MCVYLGVTVSDLHTAVWIVAVVGELTGVVSLSWDFNLRS